MNMTAAVFCGSSMGNSPAYADAARAVGASIASRGWSMVYGGATVGLMGVVADAALAGGVQVTGVIPHFLAEREIQHTGLAELILVDDQESRKREMLKRADVAIILPGGLGTLDEVFEVWTGTQLALWRKPLGFLNTRGYFDPLKATIDHAVGEGFMGQAAAQSAIYDADVDELLDAVHAWSLPRAGQRVGSHAARIHAGPDAETPCPKLASV